jgi:hypothetical protein
LVWPRAGAGRLTSQWIPVPEVGACPRRPQPRTASGFTQRRRKPQLRPTRWFGLYRQATRLKRPRIGWRHFNPERPAHRRSS